MIEDDSLIEEVTIGWSDAVAGVRVTVFPLGDARQAPGRMSDYEAAQARLADAKRRRDSREIHAAVVESKRQMTLVLREKFRPRPRSNRRHRRSARAG